MNEVTAGTRSAPAAALPAAFEPPSAGFALDWRSVAALRAHGVGFATITHAAGISSTGDDSLDAMLPFDEPYQIPSATAKAIAMTGANGGRVIATQKVTVTTRLKVVDVLLSGVHEPGTSHYELMRAFVDDETLQVATAQMAALGYRTHEFGDSVLVSARARTAVRRETSPAVLHRQGSASSGASLSI